ncbi:cytochrome o ubiquinol oxidase subunit IV [Aureimonas psammosilenae]|uniref:cytochrome o ubiquinol oxidase subunit IV n=1 Tax=Aureimonas psammosilenae TaxID=2495496 RepID=UPI0012607ECC|nr:cytochrome o ubiquinol oxidase subunit IV [Aureimonas psammosilenae]
MTQVHTDPALHAHGDTHGHGSRRGYLVGFALSVLLTAVPFALVMGGMPLGPWSIALAIFGLGLVQIVVHATCFLHLDSRSEGGWTLLAFLFTAVLVAITIAGSIWIMYHLDTNMMPMGPAGSMSGAM